MPKPDATPQGAPTVAGLLTRPVGVINIGLESFAVELRRQGAAVVHVEWSPPAGGDAKLAALLAKLGM